MSRIRPAEDVRPLSEFRANTASVVKQVRGTKRPVILTVRGRSAAVLLDVGEYDALMDQLELLRDARMAEGQLRRGRGVSRARAQAKILSRFRR